MRVYIVGLLLGLVLAEITGCQKEGPELVDQTPPVRDGESSQPVVETESSQGKPENQDAPGPDVAREVPDRRPADYQAGRFADVMLVRLFADPVFAGLDQNKRVLAYHLARAVLAGRDIVFDQIHQNGLEVRDLIERILRNSVGRDPETENALSVYLKRMWIHGGFYDSFTGQKFLPELTFEQFAQAASAAHSAGADLGLTKGEPLEAKLSRLKPVIFDPHDQPVLADPRPAGGQDILKDSHLNTYHRVSSTDLKRFDESYPKNSRLIRIDGRLVEEIYRAGDKRRQIPPGRYKEELRKVIRRLQDAMTSARRAQRKVLVNLVEFFRTGDAAAFDAACLGWRAKPATIEFYLGFTDTRLDPRHAKGMFTGVVGIVDPPANSRVRSIARHVQHFEDSLPWEPEFKKHWTRRPVAAAVQLLVTAGQAGPLCRSGREVPSSYANAPDEPAKVLVFSNVIEARRMAVGTRVLEEFVHPAYRKETEEKLEPIAFDHAALREVLGPNLGKTPEKSPRRLRDAYPVLRALKAELVSLWLLADGKLVELGYAAGGDAALWAYRYLMADMLVEQALMNQDDNRSPAIIARRIMMRYLVEKAEVVRLEEVGGKTYPVVAELKPFREALGHLLQRCQRILVTADRPAARTLFKNHAGPAQWPALPRVAERARKAGLRRLVACLMPKLSPQRDATGRVAIVTISHRESFERQMMRYRLY